MASLVSCPHCAVACKIIETTCPHCGATMRTADGRLARTAAAALLGLTLSACGGKKEPEAVPAYGIAEVPPTPPPTAAPTAAPDVDPPPAPSATTVPEDMGGGDAVPAYGVAPVPLPEP